MIRLKETGAIEHYSGKYLLDLQGNLYDNLYLQATLLPYKRAIVNNFTDPKQIFESDRKDRRNLWGWSFLPDDFVYMGNMLLPTSIALIDYVATLQLNDKSKPYPRGLTCHRSPRSPLTIDRVEF